AGARPLVLALIAAVGFGLALLFIAEGSQTSTLMTLVAMRATSVTVVAVGLAVVVGRSRRTSTSPGLHLDRQQLGLVTLVGLGDVAANLTFGMASTRGLVSVVAVLGSLYPVVTVLLARVVHAERLGRAQTIGVASALAGVVLIGVG
ncbi:MAG: EamA family transporter, partial [Actinomycetes bacterium]